MTAGISSTERRSNPDPPRRGLSGFAWVYLASIAASAMLLGWLALGQVTPIDLKFGGLGHLVEAAPERRPLLAGKAGPNRRKVDVTHGRKVLCRSWACPEFWGVRATDGTWNSS